jgi:hypothetical protein
MVFEDWNRNYNRVQSVPSKAEVKGAVEAFGAIAESPLSKNLELAAIISGLERALLRDKGTVRSPGRGHS